MSRQRRRFREKKRPAERACSVWREKRGGKGSFSGEESPWLKVSQEKREKGKVILSSVKERGQGTNVKTDGGERDDAT